MELSSSQTFFELSKNFIFRCRFLSVKEFAGKFVALPFAFAFKVYKTFFRIFGLGLGAFFVICSLGLSTSVRRWFVFRFSQLAKDLADWFLWPLSILAYFFRFLFALCN